MTQKLGRNKNSYCGETIDAELVLQECMKSAERSGFAIETLPLGKPEIFVLTRVLDSAKRKIYISAGIHGDEPAGTLALSELLNENTWPDDASLWILPCLNPTGLRAHTRENDKSMDLNRDYRHLETEEVRAHTKWLAQAPNFDLSICLHEDWESDGFYIYEARQDNHQSTAEKVIKKVKEVFPIDKSLLIDGYPANDGVIRSFCECESFEYWPEAIYLCQMKQAVNYTFETPSDFPLSDRVRVMKIAIMTAIG